MPRRAIHNEQMPKPFGPYSPAVAASGELVFISGQPGIELKSGEVPADFASQARNAFENVASVARAAGVTLADVVKTTVYLADASQFETLNALFGEYFPENLRPAPPLSCNFLTACLSRLRQSRSDPEHRRSAPTDGNPKQTYAA